ncbi:MAG TPA: DUF3307 domain-containing protein [Roseiflexaceae bacterium]|nr:DUF3307 domain-containing protein [Roseiflexaceae bacterium]
MLYVFLLAHVVADFILQPYWLVQRKNRLSGLAIHCSIVLACMLLLGLLDARVWALWPAMLAITAVHFGADFWKVRYGHHIPGPPIGPFLLDQMIHIATLIGVLSLVMPQAQLWSLGGSAAAHTALIAAAYVIVAFAVPIGVMVWLDPRFEHLALAGHARMRCLLLGVTLLVLVQMSSLLALPAALVGLTLAARHPMSIHPLDRPIGMLSVASGAALCGLVLLVLP